MKQKLMAMLLTLCLIASLAPTAGFALLQDPLILDLESVTYGEGQNSLIIKAYFVNTSGNVASAISDVQLEVSDGTQVIASGTVDVLKEKNFNVGAGSSYPWQFVLQSPVKGANLSNAKLESRILYSTVKGAALPAGKKVYYKGIPVQFDVQPAVIGGRMMIPARAVFEKMNCTVGWNPESQTVDVTRGDRRVIIPINKDVISVDGKPVKIDVAATILNGRTLVPLRAISNALGARIVYGEANEMAVIYE